MTWIELDHAEGLMIHCGECGHKLHFTAHATVGEIQAAKREHNVLHLKAARNQQGFSVEFVERDLVAIRKTDIYLDFSKPAVLDLVIPALNSVAGRAGAWVWRYTAAESNLAHLVAKLRERAGVTDGEANRTGAAAAGEARQV